MNWMNVEETLRRVETPLFWVGAFAVASLALWLLYRLLSGFRIWVLGNGQLLSPKLGKWAGELGHINFHANLHHGHEEGSSEVGRWTRRANTRMRLLGSNFTLVQRRAAFWCVFVA